MCGITGIPKSYGTDAVRTRLRFAQNDADLHTGWLRTFANNYAALRFYDKAGSGSCRVLREYAVIDGEWLDIAVFQVVAEGELRRMRS